MQLLSGCVAREYNRRKVRKGAFWEDRYHATAVATDEHLVQCLIYVDLNMVRTGGVDHLGDWTEDNEISKGVLGSDKHYKASR